MYIITVSKKNIHYTITGYLASSYARQLKILS